MSGNIKLLILVISIFVMGFDAFSQEELSDSAKIAENDTVCYKLNFNPGDTLVYNIVSHDSIIIDYSDPLLKIRLEKIRITCDSVINNKFYLTQELIDYISRESTKDTANVERREKP